MHWPPKMEQRSNLADRTGQGDGHDKTNGRQALQDQVGSVRSTRLGSGSDLDLVGYPWKSKSMILNMV